MAIYELEFKVVYLVGPVAPQKYLHRNGAFSRHQPLINTHHLWTCQVKGTSEDDNTGSGFC